MIISCKECYGSDSLKIKLQGVFFKFTDELIFKLDKEEFETIIHSYKTFKSY